MTGDAMHDGQAGQNGRDGVTSRRRGKRGASAEPHEAEAQPPFETQLEELDGIVGALEDGRLPLEQALTLYERGMRLAKACQDRLDAAELRVRLLRVTPSAAASGATESDDDVTYTLEDFEADE